MFTSCCWKHRLVRASLKISGDVLRRSSKNMFIFANIHRSYALRFYCNEIFSSVPLQTRNARSWKHRIDRNEWKYLTLNVRLPSISLTLLKRTRIVKFCHSKRRDALINLLCFSYLLGKWWNFKQTKLCLLT